MGSDLREQQQFGNTNQVNSNVGGSCTSNASITTPNTSAQSSSNNSANALAQLKVDLENITHAQAFASAIVATINQEFYGNNGHAEAVQTPNDQDQLDIKQQQQQSSSEVGVFIAMLLNGNVFVSLKCNKYNYVICN